MVAAVKAKIRALQAANEEEESSGSDTEAEEEEDPKVVLEKDTSCGSTPRDKALPQSPESAATLHANPDSDSSWVSQICKDPPRNARRKRSFGT
jgi:hypothetical protein